MKKNLLHPLFMVLPLLCMSLLATGQVVFLVQSPSELEGSYNFTYSSANAWGADMDTVALTAEAAFAFDATAADSLVCEDVDNVGDVDGKIAFLYRGDCFFSEKALNAQNAGAVACVIINNIPGDPVGMGAGTEGAQIEIPVVMISDADGALLRDSVEQGGVEIFLGNNTGLFANNVGSYRANIGMANSSTIPTSFASTSSDFFVPVGAWVFNFGSADASDVQVDVTIDRDGTELYNETSTTGDIPSEDSLFFSLPEFSEEGYEAGLYTITYTISSADEDEFPSDNMVTAEFWINEEGLYAKSRVDAEEGPLGGNGLRPAETQEFEWCIAMTSENAESMQVTGMTFATITNEDIDLTGEAVQLKVYEWNDPISATEVSFTDLTELTDNEFYDYADDLQGEFVSHTFAQPIELFNETKYLACATIFIDNMFLTVDGGIDYQTNYETYPDEVFFPLNDFNGQGWFPGGFGPDNVPALVVNLELANSIADEMKAESITPFPNPTTDMIQIPFGEAMDGTVSLNIYDMKGQLVKTDERSMTNTNRLQVDVSDLASGIHTFNLMFEDRSTTSFRVVITK